MQSTYFAHSCAPCRHLSLITSLIAGEFCERRGIEWIKFHGATATTPDAGLAEQSRCGSQSPAPQFTLAILAKRTPPFSASEISALQRGFRAVRIAAN